MPLIEDLFQPLQSMPLPVVAMRLALAVVLGGLIGHFYPSTVGPNGEAVAGLAVVDDAQALAGAAEMMRADAVFRDVAQHFMRHFDRLLGQRAETDGDTVLAVLAETRSGRAFTLLGQITGVLGTPGPAPEAGGDQPAAS